MRRGWLMAGLVLLGCTAVTPGPSVGRRRPGQENFLIRAAFAGGRLWLLSDAGDLMSIADGADERVVSRLPEPVLDICARNGAVEAITCAPFDCAGWTLRRYENDWWSRNALVPTDGDHLVAVDCSPGTTTLLTTRRLVEVTSAGQKSVRLSEELKRRGVSSALVTADQVFLGLNLGEWGGGLRRIDRRTGKVTVVEKNASGELCGGPLNTDCDPVNGIAIVPWKPSCVAAAIGLVHFSPHGRIVEICGDDVRRLYFKAHESPPIRGLRSSPNREEEEQAELKRTGEPRETVAFFGLARVKDELWASGIDGLYRVAGEQAVTTEPLPRFKAIGNVSVGYDLPGAILVLTAVNRRLSISGNVPLLVPR